jgi:hypothetical protein
VRLSDVIAVDESKSRLGLTVGDAARDADDVVVESTSTNSSKKNVHKFLHALVRCTPKYNVAYTKRVEHSPKLTRRVRGWKR